MNESSLSGWAALSGSSPYSADNANLGQNQATSNQMMGAGMSSAPPMSNTYGGSVQPSSLNGYPMFSSQSSTTTPPSGYANSNPIDSTPSVIATQARPMGQQSPPQNPQAPTAPTFNPWNIKSSSPAGAFDYPMGQNVPPPKLNVL